MVTNGGKRYRESMDVFRLRDRLVSDYGSYVRSFITIRDERIRATVEEALNGGLLWPEPLIQLNPSFEPGESIDELVDRGILHPECHHIFRLKKSEGGPGKPLRLHRHQSDAIRAARSGANYVLTTGTGSGKSLAYIIPMVDWVLRHGSGRGIQGLVIYPMNALANSQFGELEKFLKFGYPDGGGPVTFARYTGQERGEERERILANPPDILLTNYVMLELILTRPEERKLVAAGKGLRFLVLDELHTYRGRQGADVAMLVRRARDAFEAHDLQCVGTSATLAGPGTFDEQRAEVARVASLMFGSEVAPTNVISETLRRATPERDLHDPAFLAALRARVEDPTAEISTSYSEFVCDPLSIWIESAFGIERDPVSGRLIRKKPRPLSGPDGAAHELSELTGLPVDTCLEAIKSHLLASYRCEPDPVTGFRPFAFRLHQFISRGDKVYASPEREADRHLTLHGQQFVPGDRSRVLLPLAFCRECGQEYYVVRSTRDKDTGARVFVPRELDERDRDGDDEDGAECGFLYMSSQNPWPEDAEEILRRIPEDWTEEHRGARRVRKDHEKDLPKPVRVAPDGKESPSGIDCVFVSAPFRFCLNCGVAYSPKQKSDFPKLALLATEGRSTATTILSLAAVRYLRDTEGLSDSARKLLSFTDNRQDASLQAGHFNDFVRVGVLRSALYKAVQSAGKEGIRHEDLVQKVFDALDLPLTLYAADPDVKFHALEETKRALREVLGYRLYRDLKRGWRITLPNLEQCGLLEIKYLSLDELCKDEECWAGAHPALVTASPRVREEIAKTLLDFMRRELAIKVDYLDPTYQERIRQLSSQKLERPWGIDENEETKMETARVLFPRSRSKDDYGGHVYLSPRGGFGLYLRRTLAPRGSGVNLTLSDRERIAKDLLVVLKKAGLVQEVIPSSGDGDVPGYQAPASAFLWVAADGTRPFHDPIRVPRWPETGGQTNQFFIEFYRSVGAQALGLEAREHTAQVNSGQRREREELFREGKLPILYCSPTMELGVDIKELNVVNMRNIPPTPANYVQRSGRAGRSGQPALVFSYCSTFSSHDQYFFRRPERMVGGVVNPPRLDLANEDLIRAHVHAIWLAETGIKLGSSLKDVLDVTGDDPSLEPLPSVKDGIHDPGARRRAFERASRVLETIREHLLAADWYTEDWLEKTLAQVELRFEAACERWKLLYRSSLEQYKRQTKVISDASRTQDEKNRARRLRAEAESQLSLLTEAESAIEGDFYSYRYFASEGFLPGYSFPRLPLSAYIPGRRPKKGRDEFLSRPRFLAISEFGPRSIVYHEGSRYRINKVILPVRESVAGDEDIVTTAAKLCDNCGYLHHTPGGAGPDLCERCGSALPAPLGSLFRLQNVSTKRADQINADEEERMRIGYEIRTGIRFAEHGGRPASRIGVAMGANGELARLTYGDAATIWRINLGWLRRANRDQHGFVLDIERGYWAKNDQDSEDDDQDDPMSPRTRRVIPYVEDWRNCLLFETLRPVDTAVMASLQAALKNAIGVVYQLEESELAAEPLPSFDDRRLILFYEAAEGGAGVLRRLLDEPQALANVARQALEICHFNPETGQDLRRAQGSKEDCEAACYDCLMSYTNQMDHRILDRHKVKDILMALAVCKVESSPSVVPRSQHLADLERACESDLERRWLRYMDSRGLRLPSRAQVFIKACSTRPDFFYDDSQTAIYVDGSPHKYPERHARDRKQTECMEDAGYHVIRFGSDEDWDAIIERYPYVFGRLS